MSLFVAFDAHRSFAHALYLFIPLRFDVENLSAPRVGTPSQIGILQHLPVGEKDLVLLECECIHILGYYSAIQPQPTVRALHPQNPSIRDLF